MMQSTKGLILEAQHVRLEPLSMEHLPGLIEAGRDSAVFDLFPKPIRTADDMRTALEAAMEDRDRGVSVPFATLERQSGEVIGSTRFGNIDWDHRRAEIGWTWISPAWQRTAVNTEAKFLMLRHAFETWELNRIEFKTDSLNAKSRAALLRIGALEEGTFRNHMVTTSGRIRHSVYFSVVREEWPATRVRLEEMMTRPSREPITENLPVLKTRSF